MGTAVTLMLAAVATVGVLSGTRMGQVSLGISPDRVRKLQMERSGDLNDVNEPDHQELDSDRAEPNGAD